MSSPNLNNIIILGCMFCYTSVVLLGLDGRILSSDEYGTNCNVRYNFLWFVVFVLCFFYTSESLRFAQCPWGGGLLPYMGYMRMCCGIGYSFWRFSILN